MYPKFLRLTKSLTVSLEKLLNWFTTQEHNPLYFHGAIPLYLFWLHVFTGILLWMYYIPTLDRAWSSVNYISALPTPGNPINMDGGIPYGAVVRGIHRWGAAALMITTLLHMLRVYFTDRHRSWRWLPWVSGVGLLACVLFTGLSGYLLVWDNRAYYLVVASQHLLGALPGIGGALSAFLVGGSGITDYTLTRFLFFHVGAACLIFFLVWVHFIRLHEPVATPSRANNFLIMGLVLVAAGTFPAINITHELLAKYGSDPRIAAQAAYVASDAPAQIGRLVETIRYDAWYMFPYWLIQNLGLGWTWVVLGGAAALLCVAPFYPKDRRANIAEVVEAKCTGCTFCSLDCPFEAITMVDRAPGSKFKQIAVVQAARCSECGICVGACPFQAIELPELHSKTIEADLLALLNKGA